MATSLYDGLLTEDQLLDSMILLNEYTTFWDGKFKDMTVFEQSEVEHLLEEVAEIVVRQILISHCLNSPGTNQGSQSKARKASSI